MNDKSSLDHALDAYAPLEIAARIESSGVAKANLPLIPLLALGVLAGSFIAFGAMTYTLVITGSELGFGPTRALGGIAFSLGLILVIVAGAELFTGNNLITMAWADGKVSSSALLRNWGLVYVANFAGSLGAVVLVYLAGTLSLDAHAVGVTALKIALAKVELPFWQALFRGILCNALVCLAVWLSFSARRVGGKILAIVFPIAAFVALGFEHSIANMYAIPIGLLAAHDPVIVAAAALSTDALTALTVSGFLTNLVAVTIGNIIGGGGFVALVYYLIYIRGRKRPS
jgi:formate transporter